MVTIGKGRDVMTLINVFTVRPEKQQALVDLLIEATDRTIKRQPGFVSATIHRSLDGTKVVNYAQWRSKRDFDAMRSNPETWPHMEAAAALASFDPIVCEVVDSIGDDR